jgi:hypothetical protein
MNTSLNGIPACIHLQQEPLICPQCGSTARVAPGLCLSGMLALGIGADVKTSQTLDGLLSEIDVQDSDWRLSQSSSSEEIQRMNYWKIICNKISKAGFVNSH